MTCVEHDYETVWCRNCGGYCGMACTICGDMTDGGEHTYVTMEWCDCDNQIFSFNPDESDVCGHLQTEDQADGVYCLDCGEYLGTHDEMENR